MNKDMTAARGHGKARDVLNVQMAAEMSYLVRQWEETTGNRVEHALESEEVKKLVQALSLIHI